MLQRCTDVPAELEASGSDVLLGGENEFPVPEERCVAAPGGVALCVCAASDNSLLTRPPTPLSPASATGKRRRRPQTSATGAPGRIRRPCARCVAGGALTRDECCQRPPLRSQAATDPPLSQADGNASGKRSVTRSAVSRGEGAADRTPLAPGEAGAKIVRSANPWTRVGPSDEHERLIRNVKGCVAVASPCRCSLGGGH